MDGALLVIASPHSAPSAALLSTFGGSSVFGVGVSFAFVIAGKPKRDGPTLRLGGLNGNLNGDIHSRLRGFFFE